MKIALINENSQAAKNELICNTLKGVVEPMGHIVFNYGMYGAEDKNSLTYVQNGILAAILLNSKAADFVITGCGTGVGAMLALNSFPNVVCGLVIDPSDAFMFGQINDGNAISMPYAKGFGWGADLNLQYVYKNLFEGERGLGYPRERAAVMKANREILNQVKKVTHTDMLTILKNIDQALLKGAISGENFQELFFANCQDAEIAAYLKKIIA
jgi:ribose 5-phosphate isomerase RpiB